MRELLTDLSNEHTVIQAIEDNMFSFWMNYGRVEGCEAFEDDRLMYFMTDMAHPLFNGVFRAQLTVSQIEPTISDIIHRFSEHKLPWFWWTGAATLPSNLGEHLKIQGLTSAGTVPGMAVELRGLPDNVPAPQALQIEAVTTPTALRQWIDVLALGNDTHPTLNKPFYELEARLGINTPRAPHRYLAVLDGEPAAVSALHLDAGVAGIYAVATIPQARRRGIGAAVTLRALLDARALGYQVGILQASTMGHSVYERLGYKDFCQLEIFYSQPG